MKLLWIILFHIICCQGFAVNDDIVLLMPDTSCILHEDAVQENCFFLNDTNGNLTYISKIIKHGNTYTPYLIQHTVLRDSFLYDKQYQSDISDPSNEQQSLSMKKEIIAQYPDPFQSMIRWNEFEYKYPGQQKKYLYFQNKIYHSRTFNTSGSNHTSRFFKQSMIIGCKGKLWKSLNWNLLEYEYSHAKRPTIIMARAPYWYYKHYKFPYDYQKMVNNAFFLNMYYERFTRLNKLKLLNETSIKNTRIASNSGWKTQYSSDEQQKFIQLLHDSNIEFKSDSQKHNTNTIEKSFLPLLLADPINHKSRIDKNDWAVNCFFNSKNGDFFQAFSFPAEVNDGKLLCSRDLALDYLAGVEICRNSTVGIILDPKNKVILINENKTFDKKKILFSSTNTQNHWRPSSLPKDLKTVRADRTLFFIFDGQFVGSWCPIWELDIWQRVGYMLKKHPEGIYLVGYGTLLQAEETQSVEEEHAFIQKHGVLITPELYTALEYLRQSQKKTSSH